MIKGLLIFGLTRRPIVLLILMMFVGGGLLAFMRLNIEAYPNPAPVILEITAQTPGLSAEEMERYYTIPIEVGLAATPGVENIRSTSFYGLSFVRVTFAYGVDYYFALTQAQINLQQNVSLPNGVTPQILGSSLVGEIYRYQLVGPPHFGLTNLRTVQDWIFQRRLLSVPGVVQVNTWGGTTKEYEVEVDLNKLDAYGVTLPQITAAIGNANTNVGGRTINIGQQSVNIRGVGLIDSGGSSDLTQGYHVSDIENIVLAQQNGVPITVKDVAKVYIGNTPRLGKAGRDHEDDVVAAIVVMNRTLHTNEVAARIKAEVEKINTDGSLPPGVKIVPFYDRTTARRRYHRDRDAQPAVRVHPDLHRAVAVSRRPAQRHHCRRQHPVCAVLHHHHPRAAQRGRQPALGRRGRFRHHRRCCRDPGGKHLSQFPVPAGGEAGPASGARRGAMGQRSDPFGARIRAANLVRSAAPHFRQRTPDRQGGVLFDRDYRGSLHPAIHHAGRRGPDLQSDGTDLRLCLDRGIDCDLHRHALPGLAAVARACARGGNFDRPRACGASIRRC